MNDIRIEKLKLLRLSKCKGFLICKRMDVEENYHERQNLIKGAICNEPVVNTQLIPNVTYAVFIKNKKGYTS